jgi:adenylate cyclase class 2
MTTEPLEIEVKFFLRDLDGLLREVKATGAVSRGRYFETNFRFDDDHGKLMKSASLLRLRQDERAYLTLKVRPRQIDPRFKTYLEYEVSVSDFGAMASILEHLGFKKRQVYEKWRETFDLAGTRLCVDTMPFGDFIEIEGSKESIVRTAEQLGFDWEKRILANYLAIFARIKRRFSLPFNDVTFRNFDSFRIDIGPVIREMMGS